MNHELLIRLVYHSLLVGRQRSVMTAMGFQPATSHRETASEERVAVGPTKCLLRQQYTTIMHDDRNELIGDVKGKTRRWKTLKNRTNSM